MNSLQKSLQSARRGLVLGLGFFVTFGLNAVMAAPPITQAQRTKIVEIPNGSVSSGGVTRPTFNVGGLVIVGNDAFQIKSDTNDTIGTGWTTFHRIQNFQSANSVSHVYIVRMKNGTAPVSMGHGNGMAYYRSPGTDATVVGSFYIAMMNPAGQNQVAQVNATGEVTAQFKARLGSVEKSIASITTYDADSAVFVVGTAGENVADPVNTDIIWKPYYVAVIVGNYFELADKFYVPTTRTYNIGQDIYYEPNDDELLVVVWDGKNKLGTATGRKNRVIVVELGSIFDETKYSPKRWINLTVSEGDAQKFEYEGIARDSLGRLIISVNVVLPAGTAVDAIYKITAQ